MMTEERTGIERRYAPVEMRVDADGKVEGYAAVFDQWSEDLGFFKERIQEGAFSKTIREADIRALFNHDPNYVLGRNRAGTLELLEDDHGLQFKITPPDTQWSHDLRSSIMRGDIDQASFSFEVVEDNWNHNTEPAERDLIEVKLYDVSVVTYPAYPQTSVSARSLAEMFIASVQLTGDQSEIRYMLEKLDDIIAASVPVQESGAGVDLAAEAATRARVMHRKRKLELERLRLINKIEVK